MMVHICTDHDMFTTFMLTSSHTILGISNNQLKSIGTGMVPINTVVKGHVQTIKLLDIACVLNTGQNLILLTRILDVGLCTSIRKESFAIITTKGNIASIAKCDGWLLSQICPYLLIPSRSVRSIYQISLVIL